MKRLISIGLGALFVAIATHGSLFAQSSYGSNSGGGGGSFGSSGSAFSSASNAFGSSGAFGSSSTSSGAFGTTANGANGANGGMVGMSGGGMYGATGYGAQNGAGRVGSNYSSSSQYGNRSAGQNGQFGGGQGRQGGGSRRGGTGQNQGQSGGGGTAPKDQQPWYEPRIEVGFSVPTPAPTVVQTNIAAPLHAPALSSRFGSVNVSVQGSTVTLRGTVPSEEDRQLAAQMAMLEPTVSSVQNDLTVAAPATPAAMPPR
jgi:hypothetical protein